MSYKILKASFKDFRNLTSKPIDFSKNINCILGENGNGKTNLLEALYYLCQRKSFRKNANFAQIIGIDSEDFELQMSGLIEDQQNDQRESYSGKINQSTSFWHLDNLPLKRKKNIPIVFINPFDSYEFHTSAQFRRDWINGHLSQLNLEFKTLLSQYSKLLRMRNQLLAKNSPNDKNVILSMTHKLSELNYNLIRFKNIFLNELNQFSSSTFKQIFSEDHTLEFKLSSKLENLDVEKIYLEINSRYEKDIQRGTTTFGVHKDDYVFHFDGFNSFEFCSLGQQKMSYLSLVFAYVELFRYKFKTYPIVLIDDVSGELDTHRWTRLIDYLKVKDFQVFITTANENFRSELEKIENAKKIFIEKGEIL